MASLKKYEMLECFTCPTCGKDYGRTNLIFNDCEIWVGCDCLVQDKVFIFNTKNLNEWLEDPKRVFVPLNPEEVQ